MACRPSAARLLRRLVAVLAVLGLGAACGKGPPKYERQTADQWAEALWSGSAPEVVRASDALMTFADTHPDEVIAALERQLLRTPPTPQGVAFVIALDPAEARRLGLQNRPPADVIAIQLGHIRQRVEAGGDTPASLRATSGGEVEVMLDGERTREQAERVQRRLALRAALDLRRIVDDPAKVPGTSRKAPVYDGAVPYATRLETEARRFAEAAAAGGPYRPEDPRWRVAPRAGAPVDRLSAADVVLLEEPAPGTPIVDETWFSPATPETGTDGTPGLRLTVRLEKAQGYEEFVRASAGRRWAVVVDGRVMGTLPAPLAPAATLWIPLERGTTAPEVHAQAVADLAVALVSGRLPWPMATQPLAKEYGRDPAPGNPISKTIAALGSAAVPALTRVRDGTGPAWGKASAAWALEQIGLIEGQGAPPPK